MSGKPIDKKQIVLKPAIYNALDAYCKRRHRSMAGIIEELLAKYLKDKKPASKKPEKQKAPPKPSSKVQKTKKDTPNCKKVSNNEKIVCHEEVTNLKNREENSSSKNVEPEIADTKNVRGSGIYFF